MKEFTLDNTKFKLPTWNRLTRGQFVEIARLNLEHGNNIREFLAKAFLCLTGFKVAKKRPRWLPGKKNEARDLSYQIVYGKDRYWIGVNDYRDLVDGVKPFFFEVQDTLKEGREVTSYRFRPTITKQLIPVIKKGWFGKLAGPSDFLYNSRVNELVKAEVNFDKYNSTGEIKYLDKLICTLYRPVDRRKKPGRKRYDGDTRKPFNDYNIETRAGKLKINPVIKHAVYIWYQGIRNKLMEKYSHVYKPGSGKSKGVMEGYLNAFQLLSGFDPTKDNQLEHMYAHQFLYALDQKIARFEEQKKEIEKAKKHNKP